MSEKFTDVITLNDVNNGAVTDLFEDEFKKLLNNLADEDTSWKTQREISIKLKVKLNSEERNSAVSMIEVVSKLAPPKPNEEIIHLDFDGRNVTAHSMDHGKQMNLENITNIEEAQ
jgi:hypothetical protein